MNLAANAIQKINKIRHSSWSSSIQMNKTSADQRTKRKKRKTEKKEKRERKKDSKQKKITHTQKEKKTDK